MHRNSDYIRKFDRNYCFDEEAVLPLELEWKLKLSDANRPMSMPLIEGNNLYILSILEKIKGIYSSAVVSSINSIKGIKNWDYKIDYRSGWLSQSLLHNGVFITSTKSGIISVKDGELIFETKIGDRVISIVEQGGYFYASRPDGIYVINSSGENLKKIDVDRPSITAAANEMIVFGSKNSLFCFSLSENKIVWEKDLEEAGRYYDKIDSRIQKKDVYVKGRLRNRFPILSEAFIYCCVGINIICLDLKNGNEIWKSEGMGDPVISGDKVLSFCETGDLFCIAKSDGSCLYKKKPSAIRGLTVSLPFLTNEFLFVCANKIMAININNGDLYWEYETKEDSYFSDPVFVNGRLYVGCSDGHLYCFKSSSL
jgi:outer membrane protein assembly factor BamB